MVASGGGDKNRGQIWRYTPAGLKHGVLHLLYESTNKGNLDQPDCLTVSPRGGVVVCEDGDGGARDGGTNRIRVFTPEGTIEEFARNDTPLKLGGKAVGRTEWTGSTYSPDGKWLFVSLQVPGKTFAITGPWERGWL
jgi:secreted PhoX family phosphatase